MRLCHVDNRRSRDIFAKYVILVSVTNRANNRLISNGCIELENTESVTGEKAGHMCAAATTIRQKSLADVSVTMSYFRYLRHFIVDKSNRRPRERRVFGR